MQGTGFLGRLEQRWSRRQDERRDDELLGELFEAQSEVHIRATGQAVWDLVEADGVEALLLEGHRVKLFTVPGTAVDGHDRTLFVFRTTDQGQLAVLESDVLTHLPPSLSVRRSRTERVSTIERHELTDAAGGCRYVVRFESKVPVGFTRKVGTKLQEALDAYVTRVKVLVEAGGGAPG